MERDRYYKDSYQQILNTGAVGVVANMIHRLLEKRIGSNYKTVLELGAGHGQHLKFVQHEFTTYHETDFRPSNLPNRSQEEHRGQIVQGFSDAENLSGFPDNSIDRVITTCLIVHLAQPEQALEEWRRVTRSGGLITIQVASEPGLLLRLLRSLTTVRKAAKLGENHLRFHYREHINFFSRINMLIEDVYSADEVTRKFWPLQINSWNANLIIVYQIKVQK